VLRLNAKPGDTVKLSADGCSDPDGNAVEYRWWVYEDASTLRDPRTRRFPADLKLSAKDGATTNFVVPPVQREGTVHMILEVVDGGKPRLWSYRRAVVTVRP
jgi:hypothetical protein